MKNSLKLVLGTLVFLFMSCGPGKSAGDGLVRLAEDLPERFNPPDGMAWGDNTCKNPIIDSVDGTELILIKSSNGIGDYRVNGRKYGVSKGELLRINCNTGEVVGIVKD